MDGQEHGDEAGNRRHEGQREGLEPAPIALEPHREPREENGGGERVEIADAGPGPCPEPCDGQEIAG